MFRFRSPHFEFGFGRLAPAILGFFLLPAASGLAGEPALGNPQADNGWDTSAAVRVRTSSQHPLRRVIHVVDGSGISGANGEFHSNVIAPAEMWISGVPSDSAANPNPGTVRGPHWIRFDLDQVYALDEMWLWNFNENMNKPGDGKYSRQGFKGVTIEYSMSGGPNRAEWKRIFQGDIPQADERARSPVDLVVDFGGAPARHVVITAHAPPHHNHSDGTDDRCGLSEVRFFGKPAAVPGGPGRGHPMGLDPWQPYGILSTEYETPHVRWGKPLAGGPVRALLLAPEWSHRETIELAQRLEIEFTPWMAFSSKQMHAELSDLGFVSRELIHGLLTAALQEAHDVIVVGKLQWSALPEDERFEILRLVSRGTGLVYVCPPAQDAELDIVFSKHPEPDGRVEILRGVPWQALPRLRRADPARLVRTSRYGDGRVVVLDYQQPVRPPADRRIDTDLHSLTPAWIQVHRSANWPRGDAPVPEVAAYEYYQSLVARAVRWAAWRATRATVSVTLPEQARAGTRVPITAHWEGAHGTAIVALAVRDDAGRKAYAGQRPVGAGADAAAFDVPPLVAGAYRADVWLHDDTGAVLEWSSVAFSVAYDQAVTDVTLAEPLRHAGDTVKGAVRLAAPLRPGTTLRAELWDLYGRQIDRQTLETDGTTAAFAVGPLAPVHIMHEIRAVLTEDGVDRLVYRCRFPVRTRFRFDDFASVVWANSQSRNSYPTYAMLKKLREHDEADVIDTLPGTLTRKPETTYSIETEMRLRADLCASLNLLICPYNGGVGPLHAPADTHVAPGCLADPGNQAWIDRHFATDAELYAPYGPFVWTHGDESRYSDDPDVDWHPAALKQFRRLLRDELYPDLAALNREWQTQYTTWDEVMPVTFAEAKRTGNAAPWLTHRLSSDAIFAESYRRLGEVIRRHDPGARTGCDGDLGLYGPNFGYDWWRLSRTIQLLQSYHAEAITSEIKRSFARPGSVRGLWYGTYGGRNLGRPSRVEYMHYHPWYCLLHGMNTTWWWTMGEPGPFSGYAPDLTALPYFDARTRALREIKSGIGKLLLAATRQDDRIAIHFSEASRIADALYSKQANPWYFEYEDAIGGIARALEDAGLQYRFVAYAEIEQGLLQRDGYRLLFLPHSRVLSDAEAEHIRAFVDAGGVVMADIVPGTLTPTGATRATPALADAFPDAAPGTVTQLRKGRTVLLGDALLAGYYRSHKGADGWDGLGDRCQRLAELVRTQAGFEPAVRVEPLAGAMPPTEVARFDAGGGVEFVGLLRSYYHRDNNPYPARLTFADARHLYDVRAAQYLAHTDACEKPLDYRAALIARSPYRVAAVSVRTGAAAPARGRPLTVELAVEAADVPVTGTHALRLTVLGPDADEITWYAQNVLAPAGRAAATIPLALNETPGTYTLCARDVMSGVVGEHTFELEPVE